MFSIFKIISIFLALFCSSLTFNAFADSCNNDDQCQSGYKCLPRFGAEKSCIRPIFEGPAHIFDTLGDGEDMALCSDNSECDAGLKCISLRGEPKKCYRPCSDNGNECDAYRGPGFVACQQPGLVNAPDGFPNPGKLCMIVCGGTIPPCTLLPTYNQCDGTCPNAGKCANVGLPMPAMRCI